MSTHRADPWAHDPKFCGTLACPGCYAAACVPLAQRTPARRMQETYDNGDRSEDVDSGVARSREASFYTETES